MTMVFTKAFATGAVTLGFLSLITSGWAMMFLDSRHAPFVCRWVDLLDVVLMFRIIILRVLEYFQCCCRLRAYLGSSGHVQGFCPGLVLYHFRCVFRGCAATLSTDWGGSGNSEVKRLQLRQHDPVIIEGTKGLIFGPPSALYRPFLK